MGFIRIASTSDQKSADITVSEHGIEILGGFNEGLSQSLSLVSGSSSTLPGGDVTIRGGASDIAGGGIILSSGNARGSLTGLSGKVQISSAEAPRTAKDNKPIG